MNREIKFRIWDNHHKQWVGGCAIELDGTIIDIHHAEPETNCIAQQYTGLKDKNGKEIFEGDILNIEEFDEDSALGRSYSYLVEVRFGGIQYKTSFVMLNKRFGKGETLLSDSIGAYTEMEIIGNIFENPELLNKS